MNKLKLSIVGSLLLMAILVLPSCQLARFIFYNFADINDHKKFENRILVAPKIPFQFYQGTGNKYPKSVTSKEGKPVSFEQYLMDQKTVAFLIIQNDSILYEKYLDDYTASSIVPSFSVAKSVTSILIGCAIDDGLIQSVEEPMVNYLPELKKNGLDKVTIKHLLNMTSGIAFNESYVNPFGDAASFYYGLNLRKEMMEMKPSVAPGTQFSYISGNTQLLGWVLERALKGKTITQYFQEKLWSPMGMEYDGSWSIDKKTDGIEKTFCCLNMRARDYAKIGRLYLHEGNWNGAQLVSKNWVKQSTQIESTEGAVNYYHYQWWIPNPGQDFMAEGILGQFIYVNPSKNLIIVRLGKKEGEADWWQLFTQMAASY